MRHPIPSGTRDVLPEEMRELRAISERVRAVFERAEYGEVYTPALEYETVLSTAAHGDVRPAYRLFDEQGDVLALRADMTLPIARVAASRYAGAPMPLRFCYFAHAYRGVRPQRGQSREFLQAGIELLGAPAPEGTAEVLRVLCDALAAAGLDDYRIGLGDAALYGSLLDRFAVADEARARLLEQLQARDLVGLERALGGLDVSADARRLLLELPQSRGGPEMLDNGLAAAAGEPLARLRATVERLEPRVADRVILDLGLVRGLGYYTGAVFEVYDPALGVPIGGGGRYDELLGRFGRPLPAAGFALDVERLHVALAGEERGELETPGTAQPRAGVTASEGL